MNFENEEFILTWDELKLLVENSISYIKQGLSEAGYNIDQIHQRPNLKKIYDQIIQIKDKFNFDEKLIQWMERQKKIVREENKRSEEERKHKTLNKLKEISKKYPRILIDEIANLVGEQPPYFMTILKELEEKGELKFQYIKSTHAILFE
ncbi:MAG: hypothetical protein ACFFCE_19915 [Promethearchaeota archaeon]